MKRFLAVALLLLSVTCYPLYAHAAGVQEVTSPGGLKAWLVEEHSLPLVAVRVDFTKSGSAYDPPGKEGVAAMTSALLLEGAGDMDSHKFNQALEDHAIRLNFGVDEDLFHASVESLSEYKSLAFAYLGMALVQPRFDDSAIERVRAQTLSILKEQAQKPDYILQRQWAQLAYAGHPYGKPVLGTKDSINAITKTDLSYFARHYLSRENVLISVVGDITPAELGHLLDANFSHLSAHYSPDVTLADVRLPEDAKQIVMKSDIPQTMALFGGNGLKRNNPHYYAAYVMNEILGGDGSLTSLLGMEIRQKRGLAYRVGTQLDPMMYSASWIGCFATRNDKADAALQVLRATLKDFSENGPTDEELADAKKHLVGSFVLNLDSNDNIAAFLSNMQLNHLGRDYFARRNALMMAVSKDEVKTLAKQLLDPDKLLVVMVGKPDLESQP